MSSPFTHSPSLAAKVFFNSDARGQRPTPIPVTISRTSFVNRTRTGPKDFLARLHPDLRPEVFSFSGRLPLLVFADLLIPVRLPSAGSPPLHFRENSQSVFDLVFVLNALNLPITQFVLSRFLPTQTSDSATFFRLTFSGRFSPSAPSRLSPSLPLPGFAPVRGVATKKSRRPPCTRPTRFSLLDSRP